MYKVLGITNRKLCKEDFLTRMERLCKAGFSALVLREKDLEEEAYLKLAEEVFKVCKRYETPLILHNYPETAFYFLEKMAEALDEKAGITGLHLPLPVLRKFSKEQKERWSVLITRIQSLYGDCRKSDYLLGASCHSLAEVLEAQELGCTYVTAGHVFETDCKKGIPPRGIGFLQEICEKASIPVYALGGISRENVKEVISVGAAGIALMSTAMMDEKPEEFMKQ